MKPTLTPLSLTDASDLIELHEGSMIHLIYPLRIADWVLPTKGIRIKMRARNASLWIHFSKKRQSRAIWRFKYFI
jgi:hypothetical protein